MLWLQFDNQGPWGYGSGPVATVDEMFGTSWKIYQGVNEDGMTVHSYLPDTQFDGTFSGDLIEWMDDCISRGYFTDDMWINAANAGYVKTAFLATAQTLNV